MKHQIQKLPITKKDGISIFCFGDLQEGSLGFSEQDWEWFIDEFKETPNAWALGLGDYQDWLRPSMRAKLQSSISGDTSAKKMLENVLINDQDRFIKKYMLPLEGKCIGLHLGHHDYELMGGGNLTMRLAGALKAPYLGWTASTRLSLRFQRQDGTERNHGHSYTIVSTHGSGGGRTAGSDIRSLNEMVNSFICDQVVRGHSCKSISMTPVKRFHIRRQGPAGYDTQVPRMMNVGGFCESYTDGWNSTYAEKAGYMPQPLMWGVIRIKLVQSRALERRKGLIQDGQKSRKTTLLDIENVNRGRGLLSSPK